MKPVDVTFVSYDHFLEVGSRVFKTSGKVYIKILKSLFNNVKYTL